MNSLFLFSILLIPNIIDQYWTVKGDPDGEVFFDIWKGSLQGRIVIRDGKLYVENGTLNFPPYVYVGYKTIINNTEDSSYNSTTEGSFAAVEEAKELSNHSDSEPEAKNELPKNYTNNVENKDKDEELSNHSNSEPEAKSELPKNYTNNIENKDKDEELSNHSNSEPEAKNELPKNYTNNVENKDIDKELSNHSNSEPEAKNELPKNCTNNVENKDIDENKGDFSLSKNITFGTKYQQCLLFLDNSYYADNSSHLTKGRMPIYNGEMYTMTCTLSITIDPFLWRHIYNQVGKRREEAFQEILKLVTQHVSAANDVFSENTIDFRIIQFKVVKILVFHDLCNITYCEDIDDKDEDEDPSPKYMLRTHADNDYSDVCLAFLFTYRNFHNGDFSGSAFKAMPSVCTPGGVCNKYKNVGMLNLRTRKGPLELKKSQHAFVFWLGTSLGADIDRIKLYPGVPKYIMVSPDSGPFSYKFSEDSYDKIKHNMDIIEFDGRKRNCFLYS